ncbi:NirD/YgiW/YdeI family stress tolerance protein [Acinetobacter qingfengensis]|uniref:Uncharacterized protein n=1 Tax=Acinetobacter qingfengensis TaxID=1262585 RepID=A0A1E7R4W5_9GAMM|nr:NirD/YgiW/YdeI family stress tolerance protein [Acinetobacter qingfengensis]KAA8732369.1 NirD/YgiW/YdeI family stress tolerance protein [Acinetobacter qingfengensis]OEY94364.1 hypothetical protein BJI46_03205 [Acinetobacter qingfengensis]
MKKLIPAFLTTVMVLSTSAAFAGNDAQAIAQGQKNPVTAAQVAKLQDETRVTLTGTLVRQYADDHEEYEFRDQTGSIKVEIDDKLLNPHEFKANTKVKIVGEVDTHRYKPTDIEVLHVEILP